MQICMHLYCLYLHVFSARWRLNNQQSADELKITELERSIESATMATQESEWKYEEVVLTYSFFACPFPAVSVSTGMLISKVLSY